MHLTLCSLLSFEEGPLAVHNLLLYFYVCNHIGRSWIFLLRLLRQLVYILSGRSLDHTAEMGMQLAYLLGELEEVLLIGGGCYNSLAFASKTYWH